MAHLGSQLSALLEGWLQTTPAHEHPRCPGCCLPTRRCLPFPQKTSQTPLLPPGKKRCPDTFPADTGASLEHPSLPLGCWPGTSRYCPLAAPGPGRERTVPGDARGALRGPRGVPGDTAPAAGTASPRLGWAVPRTPGRRARLKWVCFGVFLIFLSRFFGKRTWLAAPGRAGCACASPRVVFPAGGWFFPKLGISGLRFVIIIGTESLSRNAPQLDFRCI